MESYTELPEICNKEKRQSNFNSDGLSPTIFTIQRYPCPAEHFHQGVLVQNYTGGGLWNLSWVDERKPDVVIIKFNERYLEDLPQFITPD